MHAEEMAAVGRRAKDLRAEAHSWLALYGYEVKLEGRAPPAHPEAYVGDLLAEVEGKVGADGGADGGEGAGDDDAAAAIAEARRLWTEAEGLHWQIALSPDGEKALRAEMARARRRLFDDAARDEATQEGRLALLAAARRWDPEKGPFPPHARAHVQGAINRKGLGADPHPEVRGRAWREAGRIAAQWNRAPSAAEIRAKAVCSVEIATETAAKWRRIGAPGVVPDAPAPALEDVADEEATPDALAEALDESDAAGRLPAALAEMGRDPAWEREHMALVLCYAQGPTIAAQQMDMPRTTVRSLRARGLAYLRALLVADRERERRAPLRARAKPRPAGRVLLPPYRRVREVTTAPARVFATPAGVTWRPAGLLRRGAPVGPRNPAIWPRPERPRPMAAWIRDRMGADVYALG